MEIEVNKEVIDKFLQGRNPQKYIVAIEATYYSNHVDLIINHPVKGKHIETDTFRPFIWMKYDAGKILYGGDRTLTRTKLNEAKITLESLRIKGDNGDIPDRLNNGYKFILTGSGSYSQLLKFLEDGGVDVFGDHKEYFMTLAPNEQYMIQTGKRLFKGMEDYNDVHRLQFDIETTGLDPNVDKTFQIGIKDNRGFETVLEVKGTTPKELRDGEVEIVKQFGKIITELKPDIIAGYNSENFDWNFINVRLGKLDYSIGDVIKTLSPKKQIYFKKNATLKLGSDTEYYNQTIFWGTNVIDIAHSVRRAQAINSSIKSWGLKYITKYSKIAKPNRVYVPGNIINTTWADEVNLYAINETNGDWYKVKGNEPLKEGYEDTTGAYIVQRYLLDDLWETEQIDYIYNQASFLLSKILPTSYVKSSTMGTASTWKLIMCAWSYEKRLGIPTLEPKRDFVGGLSRLLEVGFAKNVAKLDYAALYPNIELTHGIFPLLDISNAMRNFLLYIAETRDEFKDLKNMNAELAELEKDPTKKKEYETLKSLYDKKQLPLKILANSWFGSYGAPYIFPWGESDCAEETTCRGRLYFRLLAKFFTEKGCRALVGDTDGMNFSLPDNIETFKYTSDGTHRFNKPDKEYTGLKALVAEFNDLHMEGRMGLDIDEIALATINFARKNYADLLVNKRGETEVKLVGNSVKSKKMPGYIEEFLDVGVELLLNDKGYEFIEEYYKTVENIYSYRIPILKIASKGKIKKTVEAYKLRSKELNKNGKPLPKQAHMELIIQAGMNPKLGETIYYVNIGTGKSDGDLKTVNKNKMTKKAEKEFFIANGHYPPKINETILNCKLISNEQIEDNPNLTTDEYNVDKYLTAFNKKMMPLLVCFHPDVRKRILINIVKDRKTKISVLEERQYFTRKESELCAGLPYKPIDQDTYEDLMLMSDKEIYFWLKMEPKSIFPNNIAKDEWGELKLDYIKRMRENRLNNIDIERRLIKSLIRALEISDLNNFEKTGDLPLELDNCLSLKIINGLLYVVSKKLVEDNLLGLTEVNYGLIGDVILMYEDEAKKRHEYYKTLDLEKLTIEKANIYEMWLDYMGEQQELGLDIVTIEEENSEDIEDDEDDDDDGDDD